MKSYILDEIHIQKTDRSAGRTLGGEVVDIGNFDVINKESILHRASTTYNKIIGLVINLGYAGQTHHYAAYISTRTGCPPDLLVGKIDSTRGLLLGFGKIFLVLYRNAFNNYRRDFQFGI